MKKIKILLLLSLFITSISCSHDQETNNSEAIDGITQNTGKQVFQRPGDMSIGEFHNLIIEEYIDAEGDLSSLEDFYNFTISNHPEQASELGLREIKILDSMAVYSQIDALMRDRLLEIRNSNKISDFLYEKYIDMLNSESVDEVNNIVASIDIESLDEKDRANLESFISVFEYSQNSELAGRIDHDDEVYIASTLADGIAVSLWWWTGPAAGVITAGYSIAVYCSYEC